MIEYSYFEKALIVSGDGDFYCLIDNLKRQNKLLKVMIPNQYKYSSLLRKFNTAPSVSTQSQSLLRAPSCRNRATSCFVNWALMLPV